MEIEKVGITYKQKNESLRDLTKINQLLVGELKELEEKIAYEK